MNRKSCFSAGWYRLAQVVMLLGFITAMGCEPPGNVLTPPEGTASGQGADQVKPDPPKHTPGISSRREREKEATQ
jgi:hypothetical protein